MTARDEGRGTGLRPSAPSPCADHVEGLHVRNLMSEHAREVQELARKLMYAEEKLRAALNKGEARPGTINVPLVEWNAQSAVVHAAAELRRANDIRLGEFRPRPDIAWRDLKKTLDALDALPDPEEATPCASPDPLAAAEAEAVKIPSEDQPEDGGPVTCTHGVAMTTHCMTCLRGYDPGDALRRENTEESTLSVSADKEKTT